MVSPAATDTVKVAAEFDRSLVWEGGNSVRYLCISLTAQAVEKAQQRPPLNLALVIDASGSMQGPKLDAARRAAAGLVERLGERDVLSLVSFASEIVTHLAPMPLNADNKRTALQAIEGLQARDYTNLSGGWLRGAECVAEHGKTHRDCLNRVLLLTDGHANEGVVDARQLGREAEGLCGRGISTSAVGIGDDYSSEQIQAIAVNGGGQLHHANTPQHIVDVVMGDLSDLGSTVAENVAVEVVYPAGVKVEAVGDLPLTHQDQQVRCTLGGLVAGQPRLAIFKVTAPRGSAGEQLSLQPRVQWNPAGSQQLQTAEAGPAVLRFAEGSTNSSQSRQIALSVEVARVWQGGVMKKVVGLNRDRQYAEAKRYLQDELKYFTNYCQGLPDVAALVQEMQKALDNIAGDWGEGQRKEQEVRAFKAQRQHRDHRGQP